LVSPTETSLFGDWGMKKSQQILLNLFFDIPDRKPKMKNEESSINHAIKKDIDPLSVKKKATKIRTMDDANINNEEDQQQGEEK
jgi:hypothetical protein